MGDPFVPHVHAEAGFALTAPQTWLPIDDPGLGAALALREPEHGGFRANLVVSVVPVPDGSTLRDWQLAADLLLPAALADYLLLDLERIEIDGRPAVRRLAQHDGGGQAVTMEQWATIDGPTGYTLTASAATLRYPDVVDVFATAAASMTLRQVR